MAVGIALHEGDRGWWSIVLNTLFCLTVIFVRLRYRHVVEAPSVEGRASCRAPDATRHAALAGRCSDRARDLTRISDGGADVAHRPGPGRSGVVASPGAAPGSFLILGCARLFGWRSLFWLFQWTDVRETWAIAQGVCASGSWRGPFAERQPGDGRPGAHRDQTRRQQSDTRSPKRCTRGPRPRRIKTGGFVANSTGAAPSSVAASRISGRGFRHDDPRAAEPGRIRRLRKATGAHPAQDRAGFERHPAPASGSPRDLSEQP